MKVLRICSAIIYMMCIFSVEATTGCALQAKNPTQSPVQSERLPDIPASGPAAVAVREYLTAASGLDAAETTPFLAKGNTMDVVTEFAANAESGWAFDPKRLRLFNETGASVWAKASVEGDIVFRIGQSTNSYVSMRRQFMLVLEDGHWKIAWISPLNPASYEYLRFIRAAPAAWQFH